MHASATQCWEMVLEKLNQEIIGQRDLGKRGLPPLQTPEAMDGLKMFGFLSPSIIQVCLPPNYFYLTLNRFAFGVLLLVLVVFAQAMV